MKTQFNLMVWHRLEGHKLVHEHPCYIVDAGNISFNDLPVFEEFVNEESKFHFSIKVNGSLISVVGKPKIVHHLDLEEKVRVICVIANQIWVNDQHISYEITEEENEVL